MIAAQKEVDVIYGQDIGIAETESVYTNELYMFEYLGHTVFEGGYVVCSRQNMPAINSFPFIQQGVVGTKAIHYSTDGLQFFGLSYKDTDIPEILSSDLPDYNLQYEFAYTALQTEKITLNGKYSFTFYGFFLPDHPKAVREVKYRERIALAYENIRKEARKTAPVKSLHIKKEFDPPYSSPSFSRDKINALYPERKLEE